MANITCTGDVNISNSSGFCVGGPLTINGANDVTVTASYSNGPAINSTANITCTGDVTISNETGFCTGSSLTVKSAKDVTVTTKYDGPAIVGDFNNEIGADISCSGDIRLTNDSGFVVGNKLTIGSAGNVTITGNSSGAPLLTQTVDITCTGNVEISNTNGMAVGNKLKYNNVSDHRYVVKTGASPDSLAVYQEKNAGETFGPEILGYTVRSLKIETIHIYGEWEHDNAQHWKSCTLCDDKFDKVDHTFNGNTCTECGYTRSSNIHAYPPVIKDAINGSVEVSPKNPSRGSTVTIVPKPDEGYEVDSVTVIDKDGAPVVVTDNGDGTYSFTQPAGKVTVKVTFTEKTNIFFEDVPSGAYYYDAVMWAVENGITTGTGDTTFSPDAPCSRAQTVAFLWRAAGCPVPMSGEMLFTDVDKDSYYETAVMWALENGITKGTGDTTFSPDAACSRGQIVTFLCRAFGKETGSETPFTDVAADAYYAPSVSWAAANGVTGGTGDGYFSPDADCTRAQIVTFLYRCLGDK